MTVVDVGPSKQRLLLALLALQPSQPVSVDEIVDVLWQGKPPRTYQGLIHTYVARLRDRVEPPAGRPVRTITLTQGGYRLELDRDQLDLARFNDLAARAWRAQFNGGIDLAMELFSSALDCWRGRVLSDAGYWLSHHPAAVAVTRRRLGTVLAYADIAISCGRFEQAMTPLSDAAATDALHEGLHARLMLALAGTGQQAAALRLYAGIQSRLAEELGIGPGPELRAAHLRVLRQDLPAAQGANALRDVLL
jgi:DNA-binding SARP family transcriptional activator